MLSRVGSLHLRSTLWSTSAGTPTEGCLEVQKCRQAWAWVFVRGESESESEWVRTEGTSQNRLASNLETTEVISVIIVLLLPIPPHYLQHATLRNASSVGSILIAVI